MQLQAPQQMNQQLPVCPPSYCCWKYTKLQHIYVSRGWENECWCQWREIPQKWQLGHTWNALPSQHVWRLPPCRVLHAFHDTHEIKMTLMTHYVDSSRRNCAIQFLYRDSTCIHGWRFLMSLLCCTNSGRLPDQCQHFLPVKADVDSLGCSVKWSMWSLFMFLWQLSEHFILQYNAKSKKKRKKPQEF